jgi:type IV pilus assembly protein PilC
LSVFDNLNTQLPLSTQILINTLGFLRSYLVYIIIGSILLFILFRFSLRVPKIKYAFDRTVLSIPVVAPLAINTSMANFARILALLLKSGIKIVEAVIIVSDTFDNSVYRTKFKQAAEEIRSGGSLAEFLSKDRAIFPTILAAMVEVGESTGNLDENLFYLSDYYTEEVDSSLKNLTALIEPLIIMIMGLVVGFVALSIITPIYSITQSISR